MLKLPLNTNWRRGFFRIWIVLSVMWMIFAAVEERVPNRVGDLWIVYTMDPETREVFMSCRGSLFASKDRSECRPFDGVAVPKTSIKYVFEASPLMFGPPIAVLILMIIGVYTVAWIKRGFKRE